MTQSEPLDELASAYLDGATTPVEAARVEADPELLARVEALRAVRVALTVAPLVDDERREQSIAAALAAYDEQHQVPSSAAALGSLTPLTSRRRGPSPRAWRVVGAAAAVAALAALVPLLASLSSDTSSDDSATAPVADDAAGGTDAQVPLGAAEAGNSTSTTTARGYLVLGSFQSDDALVQALRDTPIDEQAATAPDGVGDPLSCVDDLVAGLPEGAIPILVATATVAGEATAVVVTPDEVRAAGGDCSTVRVRAR